MYVSVCMHVFMCVRMEVFNRLHTSLEPSTKEALDPNIPKFLHPLLFWGDGIEAVAESAKPAIPARHVRNPPEAQQMPARLGGVL